MQAAQAQAQSQAGPMPKGMLFGMMFSLIVMMIIIMWRTEIGEILNVVFHVIGFVNAPVVTLIIAGLVMITVSTIVRGLLTDPVAQARSQHVQSEFQAEFRQARQENNLYKMKKLQEIQPQMMQASMETSQQQMKSMPITMIFTLPMYAWVFYFVTITLPATAAFVNMPWGVLNLNDLALGFMPYWIIVYTMISLPIGQFENRLIRYLFVKKRLKQINIETTV